MCSDMFEYSFIFGMDRVWCNILGFEKWIRSDIKVESNQVRYTNFRSVFRVRNIILKHYIMLSKIKIYNIIINN